MAHHVASSGRPAKLLLHVAMIVSDAQALLKVALRVSTWEAPTYAQFDATQDIT